MVVLLLTMNCTLLIDLVIILFSWNCWNACFSYSKLIYDNYILYILYRINTFLVELTFYIASFTCHTVITRCLHNNCLCLWYLYYHLGLHWKPNTKDINKKYNYYYLLLQLLTLYIYIYCYYYYIYHNYYCIYRSYYYYHYYYYYYIYIYCYYYIWIYIYCTTTTITSTREVTIRTYFRYELVVEVDVAGTIP